MHDYKITQKELHDKDKPKESISRCKVFLCSASISESVSRSCQNSKTVVGSKPIRNSASVIPDLNITSVEDSKIESKAKTKCDAGLLLFNDLLVDPESNISSSRNSSCPNKLSEEYFDSPTGP
ncbi:uncharacterized protein [Primulina eburnea]|uniref:uncharacterized protein n=1 Tax=Primulina eburnea TaxID=1245227 RepID=UPI003C6C4647